MYSQYIHQLIHYNNIHRLASITYYMAESKPPNHFTFSIKNPGTTRNASLNNNMVAMKRIENYSYALSDQIGLGFTSHVYRGKDQLTNQPVAVKVIELKKSEDELHANFLRDEVSVLQTIKNADFTNLLRLEKVIKSKNNLYIITEFCEGNDLAKILRKKKIFSEVEAQSIMKQMLNGYRELYKLRIVHRDLKLANLFITRGQVKIADFGFAVSEQQCNIKLDYNVGSPYYMPPESLKNNQYSFLSDVWGIGVIAYQLVYGRVPWKDRDDAVLFDMVMNCPVERLFDSDKEVSEHYKKFIKACLIIDRRLRATPEFIISYQWPKARQFVQGLDDPNQFRQSMGGRNSLPRMSMEPPQFQLKKRSSLNSEQNKFMRKRTPSVDNLRRLAEIDQKTPTAPPLPQRNITVVSKSFMQGQKTQQDFSRQRNSRSREKQIVIQSRSNSKPAHEQQNQAEKAILGQIHFCRFMLQLYKVLQKMQPKPQKISLIQKQLCGKVFEKMQGLINITKTQANLLRSPGFTQYLKTPRWEQLKQLVYTYDMKFRTELHYNTLNKSHDAQTELSQTIREMKYNMPQRIKVLEYLTYYYQLKDEEGRVPAHSFLERTKIDYLVNECKDYNSNSHFLDSTSAEQSQNRERLMKKLEMMDF